MPLNLTKKVFLHTLSQSIGKIFSLGISLWTARLIFLYLQPAGVGSYSAILSYLQIFSVILGGGTVLLLSRKLGESSEKEKRGEWVNEVFNFHVWFSPLFILTSFLMSFVFPEWSMYERWSILLASFFFVFLSWTNIFNIFFQEGFKDSWVIFGDIFAKLINIIWVFFAIQQGLNILGILGGLVLSGFLNFLFLFLKIKPYVGIRFIRKPKFLYRLLMESWPIALSLAFSIIYFKGDTVILKFFRSEAETGYYGFSYKILETILLFPPLFMNLVIPRFSSAWHAKNFLWFQKALWKSSFFLFASGLGIALLLFFFSPALVIFFGGGAFLPAIPLIRILGFTTGLMFLGNFFRILLITIQKQKTLLWVNMIFSILGLLAYLLFIPSFGALGAAWVTFGGEVLLFMYFIIFVHFSLPRIIKQKQSTAL